MNTALQGWGIWLALAGACIGTYLCRAIGVLLSGKINQESEIFRWISAITYAAIRFISNRTGLSTDWFMPVEFCSDDF